MLRTSIFGLLLALPLTGIASEITYKCEFRRYTDEKGIHLSEKALNLVFVYNQTDGTAEMTGSIGQVKVIPVEGDLQVSFIEKTESGNIYVATITDDLDSVYSRNSIFLGNIIASQYFGGCTKKLSPQINQSID